MELNSHMDDDKKEVLMNKKRYLPKDKNGSATILDAIISIGITVALIAVCLYFTNALYTIQNEPGADLEVKSVGLMETLINSQGQTNSLYPEWQEEGNDILKALGLGTSQTIQYGTLRITDENEIIIDDGPYSASNPIGIDKTCFLAGTQIVMADESYKNIEDIEVGDLVKSYDEKNYEIVDKQVTHLFHHMPAEMGDYYLIINNQLRVTPNHRFYVGGNWVYADKLSIGDALFYPSTDYAVFSIEKIFERTYTYNFEVEGYHNYFVAMETTSSLVHNDPYYEGTLDVTVWTDPDPPEGSVTCEIEFNCQINNGTTPYTYEWDFGDGETFGETNDSSAIHSHNYTEEGVYDVVLVITDNNGDTGTVTLDDINIHHGPIAAFTWFDADGPYGSGKFICCNASVSSYSGDSATFKWYKDSGSVSIGTGSILYHDLGDEDIHNIKLKLIDDYGNYDSHTEQVQANSLIPVEPDSNPWVLAGKAIYPDSDSDTFQSYTAGYYVKYTSPENAPSGIRIFEVKEKTNNEQPVLDAEKIVNLGSGHYNESYSDIKSALGLVSAKAIYNFRIKITIYNESGAIDYRLIFGASDNNALAKASTTRQVLVYYPPTAIEQEVSTHTWVIDSHPKYKQAEITISIFLGGTPPEYTI